MKAIEILTDNTYNIQLVHSAGNITLEQIEKMRNSPLPYFTHIRYEGHSELVQGFKIKGFWGQPYLESINTTNPWELKQYYIDKNRQRSIDLARMNLWAHEVDRWDIFRAIPIRTPEERYKFNLIQ